jgi:hypothetical protein
VTAAQDADAVVVPNECERRRQMHQYDLHFQMGQGFCVEKCVVCKLTRGQVRALHNDRSGVAP